MAEDKDQTQKKKSTLIKHKKGAEPAASDESAKADHKKRVRVVVRKKSPKAEKPEQEPDAQPTGTEQEPPSAREDQRSEASRSEVKRTDPAEDTGQAQPSQQPRPTARRRPQQDEPRAGYSVREEAKKKRETERRERERQEAARREAGPPQGERRAPPAQGRTSAPAPGRAPARGRTGPP
ncbi:MAG: hypothetical protein GVY23_00095, partial [Spirochaetes bacterium]|nr:hypothetical protein [Spirochaetota bacterium]